MTPSFANESYPNSEQRVIDVAKLDGLGAIRRTRCLNSRAADGSYVDALAGPNVWAHRLRVLLVAILGQDCVTSPV